MSDDNFDEKTIVQWQKSYSVGIKLIDDQHKELINLTNQLFQNCLAGREQSISAFLETIHEAVDYVGYHFGTEEKVMERVNYPELAQHKSEHADFVREVFAKVEDYTEGKVRTPLSFVYFLRDWVLNHIAYCDKKMGDYLLALKRSGALHHITLKVKKDQVTNRIHIK